MKFFLTLSSVPRPSLVGVAPRLMLLVVYALFAGQNLHLMGAPVAPLAVAVVTFWLTLFASKALFWRPETLPADKYLIAALVLTSLAALYLIFWLSAAHVQWIWVVGAFGFVLSQLLFVHFSPEETPKLPSGRWFEGGSAVLAAQIRLVSWAIYICLAAFLCMHFSVHYWVVYISLGYLVWHFMTQWVIVLLIHTGDLRLK